MNFKNIFVVLLIISILLVFKVLPYYFVNVKKEIFLTYQFFAFSILILIAFLR